MKQRQTSEPAQVAASRRWPRMIVGGVAILTILALLFGRSLSGEWARYMAIRQMQAWAISDALRWLDRAEAWSSGNGGTFLLQAACYRHLNLPLQRAMALDKARELSAPRQDLNHEITLGKIQQGELAETAAAKLEELTQTDLSPHDVAAAYIQGLMARQQMQRVEELLQAWDAGYPDEPHVTYIRGLLLRQSKDEDQAREQFEQTLAAQPRHELARIAVASLAADQRKYDEAIELYTQLAAKNSANDNVLIDLARVLRETGRVDQARAVLKVTGLNHSSSPAILTEAAELELECGNYEAAEHWFARLPAKQMTNHTTLSSAALTLVLLDNTVAAERAYQWIFDEVSALTVMHDLQARLQSQPDNQEAAEELQAVIRRLGNKSADEHPYRLAVATDLPSDSRLSAGMRLYETHCAACHGDQGRGDGRAARHLYPRPRDLRQEKMRLVSTRVGIPTIQDIKTVTRDGIPGTAMVPLLTLSDAELEQLAQTVQQFQQAGVREQYVASLQAYDEPVDPEDVEETVALRTEPRQIVTVPPLGQPTEASLSLGNELYQTQTCDSCHGVTGTGDDNLPMFDDVGRPAFPRDLVHELFKGGNTPNSIYLRIALGMPGSPHPANVSLSEPELIALVHYCHSLGEQPKLQLTNHQRYIRTTSRPAVERIQHSTGPGNDKESRSHETGT